MKVPPIKGYQAPYSAIEDFANMSKEQTYYIAQKKTVTDNKTKKQHKMTRAIIRTIPLIDAVIYAAPSSKLGNIPALSNPVGMLAGRLARWASLFAVFGLIFKGINKVTDKSKKLTELEKKKPVLKTAIDIGALFGVYSVGKKGLKKLVEKVPKDIVGEVMGGIRKFRLDINRSSFARNVYEPLVTRVKEYSAKYPKSSDALKKASPYVVPALIFASIIKSAFIDPILFSKRVNKNYDNLRAAQEGVKSSVRPNK